MKDSYERYYEDSYNVANRDMHDYELAGGDGEVDLNYFLETGNIKEQRARRTTTVARYRAEIEFGVLTISKIYRPHNGEGFTYDKQKDEVISVTDGFEKMLKEADFVEGDSYAVKDMIKKAGFTWDYVNKKWFRMKEIEMKLPKLKGSVKQVKWAEDIRKRAIAIMTKSASRAKVEEAVKEYGKAKWWIENRNEDFVWLLELA
jgi:hypothetical protein